MAKTKEQKQQQAIYRMLESRVVSSGVSAFRALEGIRELSKGSVGSKSATYSIELWREEVKRCLGEVARTKEIAASIVSAEVVEAFCRTLESKHGLPLLFLNEAP